MTPVSTAPVDNSEDTEITLGTGKMLVLFFGLVILCATFFGMGYSMGRNSSKSTAELLPSPSTSKPSRPLQSTSSFNSTPSPQPDSGAKPPDQPNSLSANPNATSNSASSTSNAPPDQSAPSGQPGTSAQAQPTAAYFVQVAAVSKQEDAEALVESLKGRQYQAFIADPTPDKLFHIQVGPFSDVKDAEAMRTRLVSDGYNPILKK
jgi:DedD protein